MSYYYPSGTTADDPEFNQEDPTVAKCHICNDGGIVKWNNLRGSYECICDTCGAAVFDACSIASCVFSFEQGEYDNISECPSCMAVTEGLKCTNQMLGYRIECTCGVASNFAKREDEALENWNSLFS